ncbi:HEAT repeat domain-containing protein [Streptomyces sp. NPDC001941]|uniref:HEAT repeat domain-containing protein n=1 Tax=Streptomyces sp. NPDC001941 TaxID=3154659 RepID=UPI00331DDDDD
MINETDWSAMTHAYGPAGDVPGWLAAMRSPVSVERDEAYRDFYSAAHHQGDVYACTVAAMPYLLDLAVDDAAPGRGDALSLLVSIGDQALQRSDGIYFGPDGQETTCHTDAVTWLRAHVDTLVRLSADPDPGVRRPAIAALPLFVEDASLAAAALRERLTDEAGTRERLAAVEALADLTLRTQAPLPEGRAWLTALADDPELAPDLRLAALVHRARCTPEQITPDTVPTAIKLLRELAPPAPASSREVSCQAVRGDCPCAATEKPAQENAPPQVAAAFEDLERGQRVHAPTTGLLTTLHGVLDDRVQDRIALLTAQVTSPHPAVRHDAIAMARTLLSASRTSRQSVISLLLRLLEPGNPYTAAVAAETLKDFSAIAAPAREPLADYLTTQRTAHGGELWAARPAQLRRAHQEAVMALATLGDSRAVPSLIQALDREVDTWRALQVISHLPQAAPEFVPRLCRMLQECDLSQDQGFGGGPALSVMGTLKTLGDARAVPVLAEAVHEASRHEQWTTTTRAVEALAGFGTAAASALPTVIPLTEAPDPAVRTAAAAAWWALQGNTDAVIPLLIGLLDTHQSREAADVLADIGPAAAPALPQLRELLNAGYEWTQVHAARALWAIAGDAQGPEAVRILLAAWEQNEATAHFVTACLADMGPLAAPALARVRTELARDSCPDAWRSVGHDEDILAQCHKIVTHAG